MKDLTKTSIFISMVLRHNPGRIGISLDEHGWADTGELIAGINADTGYKLDMETLEEIVRTDEKGRYSSHDPRVYHLGSGRHRGIAGGNRNRNRMICSSYITKRTLLCPFFIMVRPMSALIKTTR